MAYFLIRMAIYTTAAAIVMNVVPGLRLDPYPYLGEPFTTIGAYAMIGLIFGTLHTFVRPIILFLTGRLYIWSMGLVALVIDVFIFLLLSYLAPTVWQVGGARLLSATLGAMLMGVIVLGLEALFGFDSPRVNEVNKSAFYWRWLGMLPTGQRNRLVENLRTQQMVNTIQSYAIDTLVGLSPFRGFRRAMQRILYRDRPRLMEDNPAVKLRLMLQELGPTFVKFGQMAAGRVEMLPVAWQAELEKLQDDVKPFAYAEVEQIIRRELGAPPDRVFATFDQHPLAAASTGQVHAATLHSGEAVIVKVRRPNVEVTVKGDLNVMQDVIDTAERRLSWLRRFGLSALFHEFSGNILIELDYTNEAYHAHLLRHKMQKLPDIHIPMIYDAWSTTSVLTQERVTGVKITDVTAIDAAGIEREETALNFFRALLQQLLFDGFFHADPHPGNVWVDLRTGQVIFLDMGMMGHLNRADRLVLGRLIWALQDRDARMVARNMVAMCAPTKGHDSAALEYDVERLINRHLLLSSTPPEITVIINDMVGLLMRHNLRLRKEFTLALKAMGQGETIMRVLMGDKSPDAILDITYTTMRALLLAQLRSQDLVAAGKPLAREVADRLPELLIATSALLDDFQRGRTPLLPGQREIDELTDDLQQNLRQGVRRIVLSVLLVGLLIGSSLMLLAPIEGRVSEYEALAVRLVAVSGFVISTAAILIMLLVVLMGTLKQQDDG